MKAEIEAKFYPINKEEVLKSLQEIKARNVQPELVMRRAVFDRRDNPKIQCTYARVRDEGKKATMSLKVNAEQGEGINAQKELQLLINSFEDGRDFLKGLGLIESCYQENKRDSWVYNDTEIVIDTWPALKTYLEIEGPSEQSVKEVANLLGLDWSTKVFVSTDELYAKQYKISKDEALKLIKFITFTDIPEEFMFK